MDNLDAIDCMSEISSSTSTSRGQMNRWFSDENRALVLRLLKIPGGMKELHMDQIQVDRKRLEALLFPENESPVSNSETAASFFNQIMLETNTYITWPTRLKIGTKSKKNPYVNVAGHYADVSIAKAKIMKLLENKSKKIIMKIDVSYTDHSHIIGKKGSSIQKVMDQTKCHIHFPDSNRTNQLEKNNQVSIHGDVENVEQARAEIRKLSSIIFSFELPVPLSQLESLETLYNQTSIDYSVRISLRNHSVLTHSVITVKGNECDIERVKKATEILSEKSLVGFNKEPVIFSTSMEISIQHHAKVLGEESNNLRKIMEHTSTEIIFADSNDPNVPVLRKSNVVIKGCLNDIYQARQLLIGLLPISIAFDIPSDRLVELSNTMHMMQLMETNDVYITRRQKFGQTNGEYVIIKGYERNAGAIYKVRNIILGFENDTSFVRVPKTYIPPENLGCGRFNDPTNPITHSKLYKKQVTSVWTNPLPRTQSKAFSPKQNNIIKFPSLQQSSTLPRNNKLGLNLELNRNLLGSESSVASSSFSHLLSCDSPSSSNYWDYERTRLAAMRAIKNSDRNLNSDNRTPTSIWSGFGVSATSPGALQTSDSRSLFFNDETVLALKNGNRNIDSEKLAVYSNNSSNIMDDTSNLTVRRVIETDWKDIGDLLVSLNLEKYITSFATNDIDLPVFCTMKESDLIELGVASFGARRKLLLAISEINKRKNTFSLAPGAERFRFNLF